MSPLVYVIVVTFNGRRWLDACLESLSRTNYDNFKVVVVDNNSSDDSVDFIRTTFPDVELIVSDDNYGFCEGNNTGIASALEANADYVVLLNNDTHVEEDWLAEITAVGEKNANVGILGAVQLIYDGNDFNSWTTSVAKNHLAELNNLNTARPWIPMRWVEGSCFAIKRKVIEEVGLLDPIYFMYYEEIDYCRRSAAHRYSTALVPRSRFHHYRGGTSKINAQAKRKRALLYDRSYLIYHATDLRRLFSVNMLRYGLAVASKCFEQLRLRRYGRMWDVIRLQPELARSFKAIRRKWKNDRARLNCSLQN